MCRAFSPAGFFAAAVFIAVSSFGFGAETWPAETSPVNIGSGLPGSQQVSGAVWNPVTQRLFIVDDNSGSITSMDSNGANRTTYTVGPSGDTDHEAITIVDYNSSTVFVGVEQSPDGVVARKIRQYS